MASRILCLSLFLAAGALFAQPAETADKVAPLLVGATAPDLTLTDQNGADHKLTELFGKQKTVVMFYRGGW